MHCASCGKNFGPEVTECPECRIAWVEARGGPPPDPTIQLTPILETGDPGMIALAKSLLEAEGIEYLVRGENLQDLFGYGRLGVGYSIVSGPAEFVVREDDAERARDVLGDLLGPPAEDTES
jgi:hypothetical protein